MKNTAKKRSDGTPPDFAPGDIARDTSREYFERGAKASIERNRWFLIALLLVGGHIANGFAWGVMLPLKTVETYQINKVEGGRLVADPNAVGHWSPDSDSISYFLNKWASNVMEVNSATIEGTLAQASEIAVGTAKDQLRELRLKDNPLIMLRDVPGYSRNYEFVSFNTVKDDVVLLRFKTVTRRGDFATTATHSMTITFTRVKPTTRAQVMKNPAGLFVTNFNLTEESVSQ